MASTPPTPEPEQPPEQPPSPAPRSGSRTAILAAVVGGLLLVALVLVVTMRDPVEFPPDSPQATVQAFLQSVGDGDPDTSLLAEDCGDGDFFDGGDRRLRVVITDATIDGDSATIDLQVTESYGAMLDDGYTHDETYRLTRTPDGWRIDDFQWPWGGCGDRFPGEG